MTGLGHGQPQLIFQIVFTGKSFIALLSFLVIQRAITIGGDKTASMFRLHRLKSTPQLQMI